MRNAVLLLPLLAAPLSAQVDEVAVLAQFKADAKLVVSDLKAATVAPKAALIDAIAAAEDALEGGGDPATAGADLAAALQDFHVALRTALTASSTALDAAWLAALEALAAGGPLGGVYPDGLLSGDGGRLDDTRADIDKLLAKLAKSLNKRLDKAEQAAEKVGVGLLAWLAPPAGLQPSTADETLVVSTFPPLAIGGLLSVSTLGASGDGRVWAVGTTNTPLDSVEVDVLTGLAALDTGTVVTPSLVWLVELDGTGGDLPEGNLLVSATVSGTGALLMHPFAIR